MSSSTRWAPPCRSCTRTPQCMLLSIRPGPRYCRRRIPPRTSARRFHTPHCRLMIDIPSSRMPIPPPMCRSRCIRLHCPYCRHRMPRCRRALHRRIATSMSPESDPCRNTRTPPCMSASIHLLHPGRHRHSSRLQPACHLHIQCRTSTSRIQCFLDTDIQVRLLSNQHCTHLHPRRYHHRTPRHQS